MLGRKREEGGFLRGIGLAWIVLIRIGKDGTAHGRGYYV